MALNNFSWNQIQTAIFAAGTASAAFMYHVYSTQPLTGNLSADVLYLLDDPFNLLAVLLIIGSLVLALFAFSVRFFFGTLNETESSFVRTSLIQSTELDFVLLLSQFEVTEIPSLLHWMCWLGSLCYLDTLQRVAHVRLEYLTPTPLSPAHYFSLGALAYTGILTLAGMVYTGVAYYQYGFLFMWVWQYYGIRLLLRVGHTVGRFFINRGDPPSIDHRHYLDVIFKGFAFLIGILHTLTLITLDELNSFLSILLFLRLGHQFIDLRSVYHLHRNFRTLQQRLASICPNATEEQLTEFADVCPVCREAMTVGTARVLPCRHILHSECLRQWLLQQPSCPVCRTQLPISPQPEPENNNIRLNFRGDRISRWLPNLSVQVVTGAATPAPPGRFQRRRMRNFQQPPDTWVQEITNMFPDLHPALVRQDLRTTHSLEATTNNILANRPAFVFSPDTAVLIEQLEQEEHLLRQFQHQQWLLQQNHQHGHNAQQQQQHHQHGQINTQEQQAQHAQQEQQEQEHEIDENDENVHDDDGVYEQFDDDDGDDDDDDGASGYFGTDAATPGTSNPITPPTGGGSTGQSANRRMHPSHVMHTISSITPAGPRSRTHRRTTGMSGSPTEGGDVDFSNDNEQSSPYMGYGVRLGGGGDTSVDAVSQGTPAAATSTATAASATASGLRFTPGARMQASSVTSPTTPVVSSPQQQQVQPTSSIRRRLILHPDGGALGVDITGVGVGTGVGVPRVQSSPMPTTSMPATPAWGIARAVSSGNDMQQQQQQPEVAPTPLNTDARARRIMMAAAAERRQKMLMEQQQQQQQQ